MSNETLKNFEWAYRTVVGGLLSVTTWFVIATYNDFQAVKADSEIDKQQHAAQIEINKNFDNRITKLEK
jgi:hypothetical protein